MKILKRKEEIAVIRVHYNKEEIVYSFAVVVKKDEEIELVDNSSERFYVISELKEKIKDLPVIIVCTGENLLYVNDKSFLKFSKDDFYYSFYNSESEKEFYTLARKEYIDKLVKEFTEEGFWLVDLYIGVFSCNLLFKEAFEDRKVVVGNIELLFDNDDCIEVNKLGTVGDKHDEEILSLSTVYNHFYPSEKLSTTYINEQLQKNKQDVKDKRDLELIGKIGFPAVFIVIAIAYLLGMVYVSKNEKLNTELLTTKYKQEQLNNLLEEETKRSEILNFTGFFKKKYLTFYINGIVKELPSTILLSDVNVFPKTNVSTSKNKKIKIDTKLISISGMFANDKDFNKWVIGLKQTLKVYTIDIVEFKKKKKTTKFKLNILLE